MWRQWGGGSIFHAYAEQVHITLWVKRGGMVTPLASPQQGMCGMHIQMCTVRRTVRAGFAVAAPSIFAWCGMCETIAALQRAGVNSRGKTEGQLMEAF